MPDILVVEDDENLNRGITFSLKKSGYEVFSAESVKKAKRIASDHNVDVTICDVNLPDGKILLMYLSRVCFKSFYRFSDFLLEKGRIKLNPQQLWISEKDI